MYSRLRGKHINYAVLHTDGQKVAAGSTTTVPVDSDGMDIAALSPAEEASCLANDASRRQNIEIVWGGFGAGAQGGARRGAEKKGVGTGKTSAQERGPAPVGGNSWVDSGVCQEAILDAPYAGGIGAAGCSRWLGCQCAAVAEGPPVSRPGGGKGGSSPGRRSIWPWVRQQTSTTGFWHSGRLPLGHVKARASLHLASSLR